MYHIGHRLCFEYLYIFSNTGCRSTTGGGSERCSSPTHLHGWHGGHPNWRSKKTNENPLCCESFSNLWKLESFRYWFCFIYGLIYHVMKEMQDLLRWFFVLGIRRSCTSFVSVSMHHEDHLLHLLRMLLHWSSWMKEWSTQAGVFCDCGFESISCQPCTVQYVHHHASWSGPAVTPYSPTSPIDAGEQAEKPKEDEDSNVDWVNWASLEKWLEIMGASDSLRRCKISLIN